jgi:hypothetical protein
MKILIPAAVTALALTTAVSVPASPAEATALVQMTIKVTTTDGRPLADVPLQATSTAGSATASRAFHTNARGVGSFEALRGSTARIEMTDGVHGYQIHAGNSKVRVTAGGLFDSNDPETPYRLDLPIGSVGTRLALSLPTLVTRRFRFVTSAGRPVANAHISESNVSVAVPEPSGGQARVVAPEQIFATTNSAGWADITTYQSETDPSALSLFGVEPGTIGAFYGYSPTIGAMVQQSLAYDSFAAKSHVKVVVPSVPRFVHTTSHRGPSRGTAVVTSTLTQRTASGSSPVGGTRVMLFSQAKASGAEHLLAATRSHRSGKVTFHVRLAHRSRLVLAIARTHVPAVVTARPR